MSSTNKQHPRFSIIIPTLNNQNDIEPFFESLSKQTFPKEKIEIIASDGGSTDKTVPILKKKGVQIIKNPYKLAEPGTHVGMDVARGEIYIILAFDNFFHDNKALIKLSKIYENKEVYAAVLKHDNEPGFSLFTKYHNTFTDPFNHYINGYASNTRTFHKIYKSIYISNIYDIYDFKSNTAVPMMSLSQGFSVRGSYKRKKHDMFDDCAPVIDLINQGKKIAYVHSISIYHDTIKNYAQFIHKQRWATQNALERKNYGIALRFSTLSRRQKLAAYIWPLYASSIILPTINGVYHGIKDREPLWFFHPVECLLCAYANFIQLFAFFWGKIFHATTISRK